MNEQEIAGAKVRPHLCKELGWPTELISNYGRVPVQIGGKTVWADFVCYISDRQKAIPWLLVEVKQPGEPLEQAVPQAESYAIILRAPFFSVTNGDSFFYYMTGNSQGRSIKLDTVPSRPTEEYLLVGAEFIHFPPLIDRLVDEFVVGLKREKKFFDDTKYHEDNVNQLNSKIFGNLNKVTPNKLKKAIEDHVMIKIPNRNAIFNEIDADFDTIKRFLYFVAEFQGDPIENIERLCDDSSGLKIKGGGIFFITQLLAAAHPNQYVVLEDNVSKALRYLGVTDILVQNDTSNGYIYINEICKKLYEDKLKDRLTKWDFGLPATHNFLWHYYAYYRERGVWCP